jgi:hypothetical protein
VLFQTGFPDVTALELLFGNGGKADKPEPNPASKFESIQN